MACHGLLKSLPGPFASEREELEPAAMTFDGCAYLDSNAGFPGGMLRGLAGGVSAIMWPWPARRKCGLLWTFSVAG